MKKSLTKFARKEIEEVHALSRRYNGKRGAHPDVLLKLVKKHTKEICELHKKKDTHFAVEVGDLLILCHELLLEHGKDPDEIRDLCYKRYKEKLSELLGLRTAIPDQRPKTKD